jgi:hypothetical protein
LADKKFENSNNKLMIPFIYAVFTLLGLVFVSDTEEIDKSTENLKILFVLSENQFLQGEYFNCSFVIPNSENIDDLSIQTGRKGELILENGIYTWKDEEPDNKPGIKHFKGTVNFEIYGEEKHLAFDKTYQVILNHFIISNGDFQGLLQKGKKNPIDVIVDGINQENITLIAENALLIKEKDTTNSKLNYYLYPKSDKDVTVSVRIHHNKKNMIIGAYYYKVCDKNKFTEIVNNRMKFVK